MTPFETFTTDLIINWNGLDSKKAGFSQKIAALREVFAATSLKTPKELLAPLIGDQIDVSPKFERYGHRP